MHFKQQKTVGNSFNLSFCTLQLPLSSLLYHENILKSEKDDARAGYCLPGWMACDHEVDAHWALRLLVLDCEVLTPEKWLIW